jgi:putative ABC transport system ATP-binding protein
VITLKDIEFHYPKSDFQLQIQTLKIEPEQRVAFIGPSGSGKTTLLNLIAGILKPAAGLVQVDGRDITKMDDSACRDFRISNIGLVFQEFELLEHLNVLDNILLPYRISPALSLNRHVRERAVQLVRDVGIEDKLRRYPHQLSQGERQRLAICRALLPDPCLLLADEPTGNLDPANKEHVLEILFECISKTKATFVAVTHDIDIVNRFDSVIDFKHFQSVGKALDKGGSR